MTGVCDGVNRVCHRTGFRVTTLHVRAPTATEAQTLLAEGVRVARVMAGARATRHQFFPVSAPWSWRLSLTR